MMKTKPHTTNRWLQVLPHNSAARLRLFCFPYAGGAASIYRQWQHYLPTTTEVCAVQLPGREQRIREQAFATMELLVEALLPNLLPHLDRPFALFGHSMGSLIAYALAQQLQQQYQLTPTHLLVSGRRAPFLPAPESPLHTLTDDKAFLTEIQQRYKNLPAVIFADAELRGLFVPLLRADFALVERYRSQDEPPLACPIVAFGGEADPHATALDLQAWQQLTSRAFALHRLPGDHFYLNQEGPALVTLIAAILSNH
ncbi:MAG TPA: alpha/beta fold hydrolase [Caldilineaceae bacterium]|nr:alpha/beta fold hydrolase [Caldilineaceae bacterium]